MRSAPQRPRIRLLVKSLTAAYAAAAALPPKRRKPLFLWL
jgi:hypothetical protein